MVDPQHGAASLFLWAVGVVFGVVYALPLLLMPVRWARAIGWRLPDERELVVYFGRCLGAVALAIVGACMRAAPRPADNMILFEVIIGASVLLCGVHIWGAMRRAQPWFETAEIALYGGAGLAALWLYLGLRA